jgi:hypothetical protein
MFELRLSQPICAPGCPGPLSFRPQFTGAYSMLLSKVAIGSRAFSNGDAIREKSGHELKQKPDLQGVGEKIKKYAPFGSTVNSVSFCAPNKIFASSEWGTTLRVICAARGIENGRSDRI